MSRALGPRVPVTGSSASPAWMVFGLCAVPFAISAAAWAAAKAAAFITGGQVTGYGFGFTVDLFSGRTALAWPHTPSALVAACAVITAIVVAAAGYAGWKMSGSWLPSAPDDPLTALAAHRRQHTALTLPATAAKAVTLRASLTGVDPRQVPPAAAGMMLGDLLLPHGRHRPGPVRLLGRYRNRPDGPPLR